jgi:HK97 family phage prohead protease
MKNKLEHRTIPCEFRVDSTTGNPTIYGYAAKYNVRSSDLGGWTEVIAPTAFDKHLQTKPDVRALFNHNEDIVLGRTTAGTLKINSDNTGLAYEVQPPDTQAARDLITSMKRGDINQSSFGFICHNAKWSTDKDTGMDVRTVQQAELFDCSPVTYPAYPQATSGVRSFPADMPLEVRSRLSKRDASDDFDDDSDN